MTWVNMASRVMNTACVYMYNIIRSMFNYKGSSTWIYNYIQHFFFIANETIKVEFWSVKIITMTDDFISQRFNIQNIIGGHNPVHRPISSTPHVLLFVFLCDEKNIQFLKLTPSQLIVLSEAQMKLRVGNILGAAGSPEKK